MKCNSDIPSLAAVEGVFSCRYGADKEAWLCRRPVEQLWLMKASRRRLGLK